MDEATASIDMATVCEASDDVQNLRPDMTQGLLTTTFSISSNLEK